MAPTPRPLSAKIFVPVVLALLTRPAQSQQLGSTFPLDDQQTAVVRVTPGQFVRVRLKDGTRAGGPLIRSTPLAFTVGPSVAYGDQDSVLRLRNVDSMWVRVYSTRRGAMVGGLIGGLAGLGIGSSSTSLCPVYGGARRCTEGAVQSMVGGVLVGGLMGALVGSGRSHWRRMLPRDGDSRALNDLTVATLTLPNDSFAFDRRAVTLMRISRGSQVRLTFGDRGDLVGYLLRTGARGAELGVTVGHPGDAPISLESLEGIWERGNARRAGSTAGVLVGSLVGILVATQSCNGRSSCSSAIIADGGAVGFLGYFVGGAVGRWFPKWHRRY